MASLLLYQMLQSGGVQHLQPIAAVAHCMAILAQQPHLLCADKNKHCEAQNIGRNEALIFLAN
jgi:hypothetical protein